MWNTKPTKVFVNCSISLANNTKGHYYLLAKPDGRIYVGVCKLKYLRHPSGLVVQPFKGDGFGGYVLSETYNAADDPMSVKLPDGEIVLVNKAIVKLSLGEENGNG